MTGGHGKHPVRITAMNSHSPQTHGLTHGRAGAIKPKQGDFQTSGSERCSNQLTQQITLAILSGSIPSGGRLPTVRELAADAGVNPNTMQRALSELEREGLLYSARTAGRYVTDDVRLVNSLKRRLAEGQIEAFLREMRELGFGNEELLDILRQELEKEE